MITWRDNSDTYQISVSSCLKWKKEFMQSNNFRIFEVLLSIKSAYAFPFIKMTSLLNFKIRAWFTKQKTGIFYHCVKSVVLLFIQKHFGIVCSNAFTKKKKQHHGRTVSIEVWLKLEELRIQCSYYQSTSFFTRHHQFLSCPRRNM